MHNEETVWTFETARFTVGLSIEELSGYRYDGDDEDGETQAALDRGDYVAFDSKVWIECDGVEIAADYLGSSVYAVETVKDFWQAHRDADPANRNTLAMRATNRCVGHYFPDMVRNAIAEARKHLADRPHIRAA